MNDMYKEMENEISILRSQERKLEEELNRLRAGQARETSSAVAGAEAQKSEVKILRVALEEIKQIKWMDKSDVGCGFVAARAIKEADKVRDDS